MEEVTGGYRIYYLNADVKTYLNVIPRESDATKINVVLQTLAENASPSVYTLNTEFKYIKTTVNNADWYFGTYGTYTTINASKTSYISDTSTIGVTQFAVWFATVGASETPDTPENPEDPETPDEVETLTLAEANALAAQQEHNTYTEKEYKVTGKITEISNTTYGNAIITDESGVTFGIYGMYKEGVRYDAMEVKPVVGDTITIQGGVGRYNENYQIKNGELIAHVPAGGTDTPDTPPATEGETLSIADAYAMGKEMEHNTYTDVKYQVTGIVQSVDNAEYGNLTLTDGNGNYLTIYGSYDATGEVSYKDMTSKPDEGDTVTIYGAVGQYSNNPQIKNGWILSFTPGELPEEDDPDGVARTLSFADTANRLSQTTTQQVWSQNGITVTNDKGASTTNVANYSNPVRFYKSSSVTIEATGIKTIVFGCNNASYASALVNSIPATSGVTVTSSGVMVTIELATTVDSFVIESLTGGQVRVNEITVYTVS